MDSPENICKCAKVSFFSSLSIPVNVDFFSLILIPFLFSLLQEAKAMASEDLLSPPPSWDLDCDCGGDPPPFFHLPPPPAPPGLLNPLEQSEDCNGPWTCPALAMDGGHPFGIDETGTLAPEMSPEVPKAVIAVCAIILGLFFVVAAVILVK